MKRILVIIFVTICLTPTLIKAAQPELVWDKTYNSGGGDVGYDVVVDASGNVYVTGITTDVDPDGMVIKYDPDGDILWSEVYDGGDTDWFYAIAADDEGCVYTTGSSYNGTDNDMITVKYNGSGDTVWTRQTDIGLPISDWDNVNFGIAVEGDYVYTTGFYDNQISEIAWTLVFTRDNIQERILSYDSGDDDKGLDVAVDGAGNIYVAGCSGHDILILAYDASYDTLWFNTYDAGDMDAAMGIEVDGQGSVFATGTSGGLPTASCYTMRCDSDGNKEWGKSYQAGIGTQANDLALDDNLVYVTGVMVDTMGVDTNFNVHTICYDKLGNLIWGCSYDSEDREAGLGIAVDDQGHMYVSGYTVEASNMDILVLKYALPSIEVTSPAAGQAFAPGDTCTITWETAGLIDDVVIEYTNEAVSGLDTVASVANTGSYDWVVPNTLGTQTRVYVADAEDYSVYRDSSGVFTIGSSTVAETAPASSTVTLEVTGNLSPSPTIHYSIPADRNGTLTFYSVDGRTVDEISVTPSSSSITWNSEDIPAGIYIVVLKSDNLSARTKFVLTK